MSADLCHIVENAEEEKVPKHVNGRIPGIHLVSPTVFSYVFDRLIAVFINLKIPSSIKSQPMAN